MRYSPAILFVLSAAVAGIAQAQIRATQIDTRVITVRPDGRVDTVFTHALSSSTHSRFEQSGAMVGFPASMRATTMIMSFGDSDLVFTYMDTTRKIYAELKPKAMLAAAMGTAGVHMKLEATDDSSAVDSLGGGPVINGHQTLHFRTHGSARLTTIIWGDTSITNTSETTDYFLAPGIKDSNTGFTGDAISPPKMDWIKDIVGPGLDSLAAHTTKRMEIFTKYGASLRSISVKSESSAAGTKTTRQTIDVLKHEQVTVPASVFAPPTNYKKVGLFDLMAPN